MRKETSLKGFASSSQLQLRGMRMIKVNEREQEKEVGEDELELF